MLLALLTLVAQSAGDPSQHGFTVAEGWTLEVLGSGVAEEAVPLRTVNDALGRSFGFVPSPVPISAPFPPRNELLSLKAPPIPEYYFRRTPILHRDWLRAGVLSLQTSRGDNPEIWFPADPIQPTLAVHSYPHEDATELVYCGPRAQSLQALTVNFVDEWTNVSTRRILVEASTDSRVFLHSPRVLRPGKIQFSDRTSLLVFELTSTLPQPEEPDCVTRSERLRALAETGAFGEAELLAALKEEHPQVRAAAVRCFEPKLRGTTSETFAVLLAQLADGERTYARQLAFSLGEIADTPRGIRGLCSILTRHAKDPDLRLAVRTGLEGQEFKFLQTLMGMKEWQEEKRERREALQELLQDVQRSTRRADLQALLDLALEPDRPAWHVRAIASSFGPPETQDLESHLEQARAHLELWGPEKRELFARGQLVYENSCVRCHAASGYGHDAPSLRGRISNGTREQSILARSLSRSSHNFPLDGEQLSALLFYLRVEWR